MITRALFLALTLAFSSGGCLAAVDFVDTAKTVSSTPVYERVSDPKQECWIERVAQQSSSPREEQHCRRIENYREVINRYDVTYLYNGKNVQTKLRNQPGNTLEVRVGPIEQGMKCDAVDSAKIISVAPNFERVKEGDHSRDAFTGVKVNYLYNGREVNTILPGTDGPQTSLLQLCLVAVSNEDKKTAPSENDGSAKSANVSVQPNANIVVNSDCGKIPLGEKWESDTSYIFAKVPPTFDFGDDQLIQKTIVELINGNRIAQQLMRKTVEESPLHDLCKGLFVVLAPRYPKELGVSDSCRVRSITECLDKQTGMDANIPYAYLRIAAEFGSKANKVGYWGKQIYSNVYLEKKAEAQKQKVEAQKQADAEEKVKKTEQALLSEALRINNVASNQRELFEVAVRKNIKSDEMGCLGSNAQCREFRLVSINSLPISRADTLNGTTQKWHVMLSFLIKSNWGMVNTGGKWSEYKTCSQYNKVGTTWTVMSSAQNFCMTPQ